VGLPDDPIEPLAEELDEFWDLDDFEEADESAPEVFNPDESLNPSVFA
jgi:hypothetical protein